MSRMDVGLAGIVSVPALQVCLCVIFGYVLFDVFDNPSNYGGDRF